MGEIVSVDVSELDRLRRGYLSGAADLVASSAKLGTEFDGSAFGGSADGKAAARAYVVAQQQLSHSSQFLSKLLEARAEAILHVTVAASAAEAANVIIAQRLIQP